MYDIDIERFMKSEIQISLIYSCDVQYIMNTQTNRMNNLQEALNCELLDSAARSPVNSRKSGTSVYWPHCHIKVIDILNSQSFFSKINILDDTIQITEAPVFGGDI